MDEEKLVRGFYTAFQQRNYREMQRLYHDDATFSDPVFRNLNSTEVRAMWAMLLSGAKDLKIAFGDIRVNAGIGTCSWEAWYTFSKTGRKVHNIIHSQMTFKDGKIISQVDHFNFWRWSRFALGTPGPLLGWTPLIQNKVRGTARKSLNAFMKNQA